MIERPDDYFELVLDRQEDWPELRGSLFAPSVVLSSDPDAYVEVRLSLLSDTAERIADVLDQESHERLQRLARLIPKGGVKPFIGAGMSAGSGMPTWARFLAEVARGRLPQAELDGLLSDEAYEVLADRLVEVCGMDLLDERLSVFEGTEPAPIQRLLPRLFRSSAFTTNFDDLIELAYLQEGRAFSMTVNGSEQWNGLAATEAQGSTALLKVHGDFRLPNTRVLTVAEYDKAYAVGSALQRDLRALLTSHVVIFLGCSLGKDRVMDVALEVAADLGHAGPRHYALLPLATHPPDPVRERFLTERHIFPIWYSPTDDHALLGDILWVLSTQVADGAP